MNEARKSEPVVRLNPSLKPILLVLRVLHVKPLHPESSDRRLSQWLVPGDPSRRV